MKPDLKESFYCGMDWPADHPYVQRRLPHLRAEPVAGRAARASRPAARPTSRRCNALSLRLMQLMALSLDLPGGLLRRRLHRPHGDAAAGALPAAPEGADERTFGAGAHTDWGAVTVLAQDAHGGLEVRMPDGDWVAATPMPGTFVVNLGDMIPRWTNGLYHSNPHRVRNTFSGGAARYSIPFFYEPEYHARIVPVPGTVPAGEAPRYTPCTAGEHLQEMYRAPTACRKR